jgi:hypothetical protein
MILLYYVELIFANLPFQREKISVKPYFIRLHAIFSNSTQLQGVVKNSIEKGSTLQAPCNMLPFFLKLSNKLNS